MSVIIEHVTEGNVLYAELRKCQFCSCTFTCSSDMAAHRSVCPKPAEWRQSDYDDSFWLPADKDVQLANLVRSQGSVMLGDYRVTLNQKQTILKKKRI
jgi:hypothetical protein